MKKLIAACLLVSGIAPLAWADVLNTSPFTKQCTFTIAGYTGASTLENLPVLVRLGTDATSGFNYADCQSDGSDIRFADKDGNLIPHEIDTWNAEGESAIWVKIPAVTGATTTFTMYYKANPAVLPAVNATDVWGEYTAVYHFRDETTDLGTFERDATANGLDAAVTGADKMKKDNRDGKVGSGFVQNDCWCYAKVPAGESFAVLSGSLTASGWLKIPSNCPVWGWMWMTKNDSGWANGKEGIGMGLGGAFKKIFMRGYKGQDLSAEVADISGEWHYVSCVYDQDTYSLYLDGVNVANASDMTPVTGMRHIR